MPASASIDFIVQGCEGGGHTEVSLSVLPQDAVQGRVPVVAGGIFDGASRPRSCSAECLWSPRWL